MSTAIMDDEGKITLPENVREGLGLKTGSRVMFVRVGPRDYRLVAKTRKMTDLAGTLPRTGRRPLTIDEMDEAIAAGAMTSLGFEPADPD